MAGAAQGLGEEYARALAARGLNLVLVAPRLEQLQPLSARLAADYGIRTKVLELDLARPDAAEQIIRHTMDLDLGLLIYQAAHTAPAAFLEQSMDDHMREIHTGVHSPLKLIYLLSQRFMARGRGGILLLASPGASRGPAYLSTSAAATAFHLVLAEELWDEWHGRGVDVLVCVPGPGGRSLESTAQSEQSIREALDALGRQPFIVPDKRNHVTEFVMRHVLPRRFSLWFMGRTLKHIYLK